MVISTVNQVVYNGDGITTAWPYTFRIIDATDIKLTIVDADGAETQVTADYYVDTINNTVYYPGYAPGAEPPAEDQPPKLQEGQKIIVYRQLPVNQLANLGEKWPFYVIEKGLDKLTMLIQDVWGWVGNNVINRVGDAWDALGLPIHNVGGPVNVADAATKDYVDRILNGFVIAGDSRTVPFDNVAQMTAAEIEVGQIAFTLGYHDINDGGAGVYNIRAKIPGDVEDGGSIIFLDNGNVAELIITGDTVDPLVFGAVCDGTTDDSEKLQACITYAKAKKITVKLSKDMRINATITVPSQVSIVAEVYNERYPKITVGADCTLAFDCVGVQNAFENVIVVNYQSVYRAYVGFDLHGNAVYDVDSFLNNCHIGYAEKGVVVRGRNVKIVNCGFSHSKYGVYYDFPAGASYIRGCEIESCRFHGIGEENDLKFINCAGVYIKCDAESNLTIRNCVCDQGCTFLEGYARNVLLENNFIQSYYGPLLKVNNEGTPSLINSFVVSGNSFVGRDGATSFGDSYNFPDNLVEIQNVRNLLFTGNALLKSYKQAVLLDTVSNSTFSDNTFFLISNTDANRIAFDLKSCSGVILQGNSSYGPGATKICAGDISYPSTIRVVNNSSFTVPTNVTIKVDNKIYVELYSGTAGTETTLTPSDIPQGTFLVRRTNGSTIWWVVRSGNYISSPACMSWDASTVDYLYHTIDPDTQKITFYIKRLTTATNAWSGVTADIVVGLLA